MKVSRTMLLIGLIVCTFFCSTSGICAQKAIELSYNSVFPDNMMGGKAQREWAAEVIKRAEGRVKINYYPAAQLYTYNPSETALASGSLDIAQFASQTMVMSSRVLELPFLFDNFTQAKEFCEKGGLDIIAKEAASSNIKPLYAIPFASHAGIFKKSVQTIEDVKGMKLRSPTQPHIDWLGTMGAANVSVAVGEVYQALQFGTIDGVISTAESMLRRKWYETVSYFLDNRFGMGVHLVAINLKRWNSLPDDIKKIMLEVSKWEQDKLFAAAEASDKDVRSQLRKNIKNTYVLPPAEIAKWKEKAEAIWAKWAKQSPAHQEALDLAKKITKDK